MKRVLITGGAGFVGSHLAQRFLDNNSCVTIYDNISTGQSTFLDKLQDQYHECHVESGDLLDFERLNAVIQLEFDLVVHLAANADIRHGLEHPGLDVQQNVIATANLLSTMRRHNVAKIVFASSSAVYGDPNGQAKAEDCPFPVQTSFYAASKVSAEALISAYCAGFGMQALIMRFTPMIGERYSHGHIFDFVKKLRTDPTRIQILGDGQQRKYCTYIGDAIDAVMLGINSMQQPVTILNVGNNDSYSIDDCVDWVAQEMGLSPIKDHTGESWAGDNPDLRVDCARIRKLGWQPRTSLREAVRLTVRYLLNNDWLLDART